MNQPREKLLAEMQTSQILNSYKETVKSREKHLSIKVEQYKSKISGYIGLDKLHYKTNLAVGQAVANFAASALTFIPVAGPMIYAGVSGVIKSSSTTWSGALVDGVISAATFNAALFTSSGAKGGVNVASLLGGSDLTSSPVPGATLSYNMQSGIGGIASSGLSLASLANSSSFRQAGGNGKIDVPVTKEVVNFKLKKSQQTISDSMAWVDSEEEEKLIYLALFSFISDLKVGGRGNLMLDTGAATTAKEFESDDIREDDYGKLALKSVDEVKQGLAALNRTTLRLITRGSRLEDRFKKYKSGASLSYETWIPQIDQAGGGKEVKSKTQMRASMITGVCLFKARTIAYMDDYIAALKASFGDQFRTAIGSNDLLPDIFTSTGGSWTYPSATGITERIGWSEYRKRWAIGSYAFHGVLRAHLGTYNLSSLPPFGENNEIDKAVRRALIDALLTQFWIVSDAYAARSVTGKISPTSECADSCMFSSSQLKNLPYINAYFNPERAWKNIGANQQIFQNAFAQLKSQKPKQVTIIKTSTTGEVEMLKAIGSFDADKISKLAVPDGGLDPDTAKAAREDLKNILRLERKRVENFLEDPDYGWGSNSNRKETTDFLLGLMPTNKTCSSNLSDFIFKRLEGLYESLYIETGNTYLQADHLCTLFLEGYKEAYDAEQGKDDNTTKLFTDEYNKIAAKGSLPSADDIKQSYRTEFGYVNPSVEQNSIVDSFADIHMAMSLEDVPQSVINQRMLQLLADLLKRG